MNDKAFADVTSHNETVAPAMKPELADAAGRRQSVALNIVENPLMVSFAIPDSAPPTNAICL
jgi:hypothetical protein